MLTRRGLLASGIAVMAARQAMGAGADGGEVHVELGDDGLHKQPWFSNTFLDLGEDLAEATAAGKDLMVLIEQNGCPYCHEMHYVNFQRPEIVDYIKAHYLVVQLDMWGSREVTDFDGEAMAEKDMVRRWGSSFTPTTLLFAQRPGHAAPESMFEARAFMLPGYFKPFHHLSALEYVATDGYIDEPNFQRWLQAKADAMREEGKEVNLWD